MWTKRILEKGTQGIVLEQFKEPALSRDVREFLNAGTAETIEELAPFAEKQSFTVEELVTICQKARIIDERDNVPLAQKIKRAAQGQLKRVVVDAIDDEPYVSSQVGPMLHRAPEIAFASEVILGALGGQERKIVVYKNMYDLNTKIPETIEGVRIEKISGRYPVEYRATRRMEQTALVIGACALIHLYRAIKLGQKQTTCFVTVAGNCVANPVNLEVSIGMSATQVLERCGLIDDPSRIIIGGPMTGILILHPDDTIMVPATRAVLAFKEDARERHYHCIGCGRCIEVCPVNINPMLIRKAYAHKKQDMVEMMDVQLCIGCGTCSYICPAKLDLAILMQKIKKEQKGEQDVEDSNL